VCALGSVCQQRNSKTNHPKAFKIGVPNDILKAAWFLGQKSRSQGHKVQENIEGRREFAPLWRAHRLVSMQFSLIKSKIL